MEPVISTRWRLRSPRSASAGGVKMMQHRRRIVGYATPVEIAADFLFEAQGNVAEARTSTFQPVESGRRSRIASITVSRAAR